MNKMNLSSDEKEWLRNQCIDPIISSALNRIDYQRKLINFPSELTHVVRTSVMFSLNEFSCNGVEFDLNGMEINIFSLAKEITAHFNLGCKKEIIDFFCKLLTNIQQRCFREMQALQIVKLEYSKLSRKKLREKVMSKLEEKYFSPEEYGMGTGMSEHELIQHSIEMDIFMKNCKKIQNKKMPL